MKSAHQIAFLNLLFIIINCGWIIILDNSKIFGVTIYDTFSRDWSYLTPHQATFNIWKVISIVLVITGILYCMVLKRADEKDILLRDKILISGNTVIINQTLLGLSMVFKLNGFLFIAYLFSIGTVYTLIILNNQFQLNDYKNPRAIHFFTRISLGLYTGWMVFLLGFNGLSTLAHHCNIHIDNTIYFYVSIIYLIVSFSYILYTCLKYLLPSIIVGYLTGILGAYYYNTQQYLVTDTYMSNMRYILLTIIVLSIGIIIYLLVRKRKKNSLDTLEVLD